MRTGWRWTLAVSNPEIGLIRLAKPYCVTGLEHMCSQSQPELFVEQQRCLACFSPRKPGPAVDAVAGLLQRPADGQYVIVQFIGKYQNFHVHSSRQAVRRMARAIRR